MARREEEREHVRGPQEAGAQEQAGAAQQQMKAGQEQIKRAQEKIEGAGIDMFTSWMKSQKSFTDSWMQAQSDLIENWISTTKNFQISFLTMLTGEQDGTKNEISRLTDSWRSFMHDSYKVFNEGVVRLQEGWKNAFDKQVEITRELAQRGSEVVKMPSR